MGSSVLESFRSFFLLATLPVIVIGCANSQLSGPEKPYRDNAGRLLEKESSLVLYRAEKDGDAKNAPSIWVDDRVMGALLPGQYIQNVLCEGPHHIGLSQNGSSVEQRTSVSAVAGQTIYLEVREASSGGFIIDHPQRKEARDVLEKLEYQSHLVNRNQPNCNEIVAGKAEPAPVLLRQVELASDAMFKFNSASISDMLPEGRRALDELAKDIINSEIAVERIRVIGHTDRLGSDEYNNRLSEERASTVAQYLRIKDVRGSIDIFGHGKREPITTNCVGDKATETLISCLQPDRRVSIELWGVQETVAEIQQP